MNGFFIQPSDAVLLINGIYSPWLVGLSFAIAAFAATMALQIAGVAVLIRGHWQRQLALACGAVALGAGTWSMHFVGMLAFDLCTPVQYATGQTLLSMLPSLAASWVALDVLARKHISNTRLVLGGALMGAGIGAMHYSGMAAMQMAPVLRYEPMGFALSIAVAMGLAMLALRIRFGLYNMLGAHKLERWQTLVLSGTVLGLAIACMHYMGMLATRFVVPSGFVASAPNTQVQHTALEIALITMLLTMLIAVVVTSVLRYRQLFGQLRASESRLQAIVDGAANGLVMLDLSGAIKTFNPAAERMFGWTAAEVMGKNAGLLVKPAFDRQFNKYLDNHRRTGDARMLGVELDIEGVHKNGESLPFRVAIGRAMLDNEAVLVGFITDTRERRAMEQALKDSEQQYLSLLSHTPGMAFRRLMLPGWPLVFMSEGALAVTGWTAQEYMAGSVVFRNLIHPEDLPRVEPIMQRAMDEQTLYGTEFRITRKDGRTRWIMSRGSVVRDAEGVPRFFDGLIMDIHERREMEDALVAAKERAELAASSKTAFLANMSHEIRTPMNAIIGFTEFLLGSELSPMQRRHLGTVRQSASSLLGLLNGILDTAKLEKGAVELEQADFSLEELATQVVDALRLVAEGKGLALQLQYHPAMGRFFRGDAMRVRQVLSNLVGNAVKFTTKGFVRLEIFDDAGQVHIAVHDTGIGIAADRIDKIFDPFSQADASMSRRFGGTGLGTTIARQLVELMQGTLWVDSTLGVGSAFHVRLPLPVGSAAQVQPEALPFELPALRILAVDDVVQNLELLGLILGQSGHQLVMASDGAQAVSAWEAERFDVVLMDVQMPGMDGLEATRRIREMEQARQLPHTPIVALTASVLEQNRAATLDAGMDGFASKPIELSALVAEIARVLGIALPSHTSLPRAEPPHSVGMPVDWARGNTLWGNAKTLEEAIRRMLHAHTDVVLQLGQHLRAGEHEAARQLVHRLRGAAGNLCLAQLQAVTTRMEEALRARTLDADSEFLLQLDASIAEIWDVLGERAEPTDSVLPQDAQAGAALPLPLEAFHALCRGLVASLRHGEIDDAGLAQLSQALRAAGQGKSAQGLGDAINAFEFQRAEELIIEQIDKFAEHASKVTV